MDKAQVDIQPYHVPVVNESVDLEKLQLGAKEAFVLSRIDGAITVDELRLVTGMLDSDLRKTLAKFVEMGLTRFKEKETSATNRAEQAKKGTHAPHNKPSAPRPENLEDRVRLLYMNIENVDYYTLLGLDRDCSRKDVKEAFHRLTREYHPDKLFRHGSQDVRERLQYIFATVNKAYKTLTHNKKRAEYDLEIKNFESAVDLSWLHAREEPVKQREKPAGKEPVSPKPVGPPQKPESMKKPLIRPASNPFSEPVQKAKRLYDMAMDEMRRKNYTSAMQNIRMAITLDKFNKKYPEALNKIESLENREQARKNYLSALEMEGGGDFDDALRLYREATLLDNENAQYYTRWARLVLEHKKNASQAKSIIQKAFDLGENSPEQYLIMGAALRELGQRPAAIAKFEKGLQVDPKNKDLQKALKRARKGK